MTYTLRLTQSQHEALRAHLFPGDGKEAVALLLCGRRRGASRHILIAREIHPVPHMSCIERTPTRVTWPTDILDDLLPSIIDNDYAVVKIHSHPIDFRSFSDTDDTSDEAVFGSIANLLGNDLPHASVIMTPSGELFGRAIVAGKIVGPLSSIMVVGHDLLIWQPNHHSVPEELAFGIDKLLEMVPRDVAPLFICSRCRCSGTGSFVVEELARLGVGKLVLIDSDCVEEKNLNRIVNSSKEDAYLSVFKVQPWQKQLPAWD